MTSVAPSLSVLSPSGDDPAVVVCGEALMDIVPTEAGALQATPGGGPFTTARALRRLGVPTAFLGRLSDDAFGHRLARRLTADGVDLGMSSVGPEPTTLAVAELDDDGMASYRFYSQGTSAPSLTPAMVPAAFAPSVRALHVGTLGLALEPMATALLGLARREAGRRVLMIDPNVRLGIAEDADAYRARVVEAMTSATAVKASDADLAWLFPGADMAAAAGRILRGPTRLVVVTLGARGAYAATPRARTLVAAPPVDVVDTIGAGDAFGAALLAWLHEHDQLRCDLDLDLDQLRAALEFACRVASLTCARAGADPPHRDEVGRAPTRPGRRSAR